MTRLCLFGLGILSLLLSLFVALKMSRPQKPFILPPRLPAAQKKQYKPPNETSLGPLTESETHVDEVIGEYREGNELYYFARYDGGIAHRVRVSPAFLKFDNIHASSH